MNRQQDVKRLSNDFLNFLLRVVRGFMRNRGLLLSGALAYYTLLSIVPLSILALTLLSHVIGKEQLLHTLLIYTGMMPGYAAVLAEQAQAFLEHRQAVGIIGFLAMLFFSSWPLGYYRVPCRLSLPVLSESFVVTSFFPLQFLIYMSFQSALV
ncbi:MAG TPA: YhjD/YihY/BrkB family envelope integrity protein [Syntrophorhabdaceae bacterium]|nr:YhjD/YihY/BrkB family envelope integrity protein [Syntrophorhabdaceae bacterium]